ncbi:MerR family transcriptional regulator [Rhodobacter aestuarii]|uniref:MerR family transcriptional regulator, redox-sensitive transcriptional activator SoxR n=1 Tax=Rhodobacter aestuarii TaxID=453582 RepID=A0A1N7JS88_9RHOB|nr:redox-sensitive transcriptional activator SoxR [Rhodobacter aestuarii]PTV96008.1 MerR family transcriptional regulator [Rhodobacter aestuarii]SIS52229.1 MerR family transcriptional regulator, redox-sensitive transcriptional activator SoxR [Rhodobacter aestuarii]
MTAATNAPNAKPARAPAAVLTVGQVAERAGVAISTLHFYEKKGLIAALRSSGNQRRYARDVLRRIAIIRVAQDLGFSLSDIAALLRPFPPDKTPDVHEVREMVAGWKAAIQARIEGLTELRDTLDGCIGCGCLSKEICPLRNPDDSLASEGKGAVLLTAGRRSPGIDESQS